MIFSRLLKNAHLRRSPRPSSLQRTKNVWSVFGEKLTAGRPKVLYSSGFQAPYIWTFLISLTNSYFFSKLLEQRILLLCFCTFIAHNREISIFQ